MADQQVSEAQRLVNQLLLLEDILETTRVAIKDCEESIAKWEDRSEPRWQRHVQLMRDSLEKEVNTKAHIEEMLNDVHAKIASLNVLDENTNINMEVLAIAASLQSRLEE